MHRQWRDLLSNITHLQAVSGGQARQPLRPCCSQPCMLRWSCQMCPCLSYGSSARGADNVGWSTIYRYLARAGGLTSIHTCSWQLQGNSCNGPAGKCYAARTDSSFLHIQRDSMSGIVVCSIIDFLYPEWRSLEKASIGTSCELTSMHSGQQRGQQRSQPQVQLRQMPSSVWSGGTWKLLSLCQPVPGRQPCACLVMTQPGAHQRFCVSAIRSHVLL